MLEHGLLRMPVLDSNNWIAALSGHRLWPQGGDMNQPQVLASSLIMCVALVQSVPALAQLRSKAVQEGPRIQSSGQKSQPPSSGTTDGSGMVGSSSTSGTTGSSASSGAEAEPFYSKSPASPAEASTSEGGGGGSTGSSPGRNESVNTEANLLRAQTEALNSLVKKVEELEKRLSKLEKKRR